MKNGPNSAEKDLQHFLKLASLQVRNRIERSASQTFDNQARVVNNQLRMLEELIKEQMPNENSGHTTRASR